MKFLNGIRQSFAVAAVLGVLASNLVVANAWAACGADPTLVCSEPTPICNAAGSSCCASGDTACLAITPEMSDYLAMAFVAVAGGMIYQLRRKSQKAQATADSAA